VEVAAQAAEAAEPVAELAARVAEAAARVAALAARVAEAAARVAAPAAPGARSRMRPSGVGINLRREHYAAVLATSRRIDWLEYQPENFMAYGGPTRRTFERCAERFTMIPHGVALSLGGPDPLDPNYLDALARLLEVAPPPWFSEHVAFSSAGEVFHDLLPLPTSRAALDHLVERARRVSGELGVPLLLENVTTYVDPPGSVLSEGDFLCELLERCEAGLLLDVNNVFVNATNRGLCPRACLRKLPLHRTKEIHLAGHCRRGTLLLDDHGGPVAPAVWELFEEAVELVGPVPVLIEWEARVPSLDRLLDEADAARAILARAARVAA
jgi:uncharacterized protein